MRAVVPMLAGLAACTFSGPFAAPAGDGGLVDGTGLEVDAMTMVDAAPPCQLAAAAWEFEEGTGSTVADATGHSHTLSVSTPRWIAGHGGGQALLLGDPAYATTPYSTDFTVTTQVSITAWLRPAQVTVRGGVFVKGDSNGTMQDWGFYQEKAELAALLNWPANSNFEPLSTGVALASDTWVFVAFVLDTTEGKLRYYKDGVLASTASVTTGALPQHATSLMLGKDAGSPAYYKGAVDSLAIWTRALSAMEIQTLAAGRCLR